MQNFGSQILSSIQPLSSEEIVPFSSSPNSVTVPSVECEEAVHKKLPAQPANLGCFFPFNPSVW